MKTLSALAAFSLLALQPHPVPARLPGAFMRLYEARMNAQDEHVEDFNACILLTQDGRFHLEKRADELINHKLNASVHEGSLDPVALFRLMSLIRHLTAAHVPEYRPPRLPLRADSYDLFVAEIPGAEGVRRVGYVTWTNGVAGAFPEDEADETKLEWAASQAALQPIRQWFDAMLAAQVKPTQQAQLTHCGQAIEDPGNLN